MKTLLYLSSIIFLLSSCIEVSFKNPQPQGRADETEFPLVLHGDFTNDDNDTLRINSTNAILCDINSKKEDMLINLSDTVKLRQLKNYYFVNLHEGNYWELYVLKLKKSQLEVFNIYADTLDRIKKLEKITSVEEIKHESGTLDRYLIDPSNKELIKMLKRNIFIKTGTFYKIEN